MTVDGGVGVLLACFGLLKCTGLSDHEIFGNRFGMLDWDRTGLDMDMGLYRVYIYPVYLPQILPFYLDKVTVGPRAGGVMSV